MTRLGLLGLGAVTHAGVDLGALAAALSEHELARSGPVPALDPERFVEPNRLRRVDRLSVLAMVAARLAVRSAGLELGPAAPRSDVGVAFGTALGCQATELRYAEKLVRDGLAATNPIDFPDSIDGAPAAHVAMALGLHGPSTTLVGGALAGEQALAHAAFALAAGRASTMLVGSGDALTPLDIRGGCAACGEGAGFVVLTRLGTGARTGWEVLGLGHAAGEHASVRAVERALAAAGLGARAIDGLTFSGERAAAEAERAVRECFDPALPSWHWPGDAARFGGSGIPRLIAAATLLRSGLARLTPRRILHHATDGGRESIVVVLGAREPGHAEAAGI